MENLERYAVESKEWIVENFKGSREDLANIYCTLCLNGRLDAVEELKVDLSYYREIIDFACQSGNVELVDYLLGYYKNVMPRESGYLEDEDDYDFDEEHRDSLYHLDLAFKNAWQEGNLVMCKLLLKTDPSILEKVGYTKDILERAGDTQWAELLFSGVRQNSSFNTLLHAVPTSVVGDISTLKQSLGEYINVALNHQCRIGNIEKVEKLLNFYGADIHYKEDTPIMIAVEMGNRKLIEYLLQDAAEPANLHARGDFVLRLARSPEMLGYLAFDKNLIESYPDYFAGRYEHNVYIKEQLAIRQERSDLDAALVTAKIEKTIKL